MTKNFEQEFVTEQEFHSRFFVPVQLIFSFECLLSRLSMFRRKLCDLSVAKCDPHYVTSSDLWEAAIRYTLLLCDNQSKSCKFLHVSAKPILRCNPKMYKNLIFRSKTVFTVRFFPVAPRFLTPFFPSQILVHMMTLSDPALNPEKNFNFSGLFFLNFSSFRPFFLTCLNVFY